MNYLTDLTKEEIKYICTAIPYQETVAYFKRNPKEFTKLRPGFRVQTLNENMIFRTLYEFRNRDFIAVYLVKKVDRWLREIDEELEKIKRMGLDKESAYINVLSGSFFANNVELFFKIKGEKKSKDYLQVLNSAVIYEVYNRKKDEEEKASIEKNLMEITENQEKLKQKSINGKMQLEKMKKDANELNIRLKETSDALAIEKERYRKSLEDNEKLKNEFKKVRDDEIWKTSEMQQKIEALSERINEKEKEVSDYLANTLELKAKVTSAEEDIETWKNQVRTREKQLFKYKAEQATLLRTKDTDKKQIKELQTALEQSLNAEKIYKEQLKLLQLENSAEINIISESVASKKCSDNEKKMPLHPENMDDFIEYFSYNLENLGLDQNEDGVIDFLNYIKKILFQGIPLLIKRGPGINIANSLANTLYGVPLAAHMLYKKGLLNWEKNEVPQNISGYKYDKKTRTFPIFINYDKKENISDTIKYEDRFIAENRLIAISRSRRNMNSKDVQNFLKSTERGIDVQLFVRKNKEDKMSKEFYYLGRVIATGNAKQFVMPNTDKTAVEIEWELETPVREDIYQYIVNE